VQSTAINLNDYSFQLRVCRPTDAARSHGQYHCVIIRLNKVLKFTI